MRAVLTEYPVKQVVVVVDRRIPAQDQLPGAARSRAVTPQHAAVTLVDRDDARNGDRTALGIGEDGRGERRVGGRIGADDRARPVAL